MYPESGELDKLSERYLEEDRDYREDLLKFKELLEGKAPTTKRGRFNAIRTFLDDNDIKFQKRFFKNLNGKATEPIIYEKIPENAELKRICEYLPVQGKALTLVLSSSGMRIGETVQLKIGDIDFNREIAKIRIRAKIAKNGKKRITFLSPEAKEAVKDWLTFQEQYLEQSENRGGRGARDDSRLFPFKRANFHFMWNNALVKAKLAKFDEKTNRIEMRPHNFRKFFRLRAGRFGRDEAEALIGHQKGLNAIYARFEGEDGDKRLEEIYVKALEDLAIYEGSVYVSDAKVKEKMGENQIKIDSLVREGYVKDYKIEFLEKEVKSLSQNVTKLNAKFEHLTAWMNMSGEEMDKLFEFIGKIHQAQSREAF
jgi:integrase